MAREAAAEEEAEKDAAHDRMIASLYTRRREPSSPVNQQSTGVTAQPVR
jgi:hypothetical protein